MKDKTFEVSKPIKWKAMLDDAATRRYALEGMAFGKNVEKLKKFTFATLGESWDEEVHSIYTKEAHSKKRSNAMHTIEIKKANLGFIVTVGCQTFVFTDEQKMFEAISEYYRNPKAAERKYCEEVPNEP